MSKKITPQVDAVVVGAGFAGLYMLYRLRELGLAGQLLLGGADLGPGGCGAGRRRRGRMAADAWWCGEGRTLDGRQCPERQPHGARQDQFLHCAFHLST